MKNLLLFALLSVAAVAQDSSFQKPGGGQASKGSSQTPTADANGQQARKIIDQCIKALGGSAYLSITAVKQEGRGYGFDRTGASSGVGVPFTRTYMYPDKERYEFFREGDWVIIHDGDKGYETTYHGTREQEQDEIADYVRRRPFALDRVLREWVANKSTAFFYEGLTIANTKQVHQISLMNSANQAVVLYIDVKTFLPIKKTYTWRNQEMREMWEESEMYDNYRTVQGVQTPFLFTTTRNEKMTGQRFLKSVTYNPALTASLFVAPPLTPKHSKK